MSETVSTEEVGDISAQEVFEKTARHLFAQGCQAVNFVPRKDGEGSGKAGFQCVYRDREGHKCAVGVWIPDQIYFPRMEYYPLQDLMHMRRELRYLSPHFELLCALQCAHDCPDGWDATIEMRKTLRDIARGFGLDDGCLTDLSFENR
jgi:hypothetical protein